MVQQKQQPQNQWQQILSDSSFQKQPIEVRQRVADNFFKERILSDQSFLEQPEETRKRVHDNFVNTIYYGEKPKEKPGTLKSFVAHLLAPSVETFYNLSTIQQPGGATKLGVQYAQEQAGLESERQRLKKNLFGESLREGEGDGFFSEKTLFALGELIGEIPSFLLAGKGTGQIPSLITKGSKIARFLQRVEQGAKTFSGHSVLRGVADPKEIAESAVVGGAFGALPARVPGEAKALLKGVGRTAATAGAGYSLAAISGLPQEERIRQGALLGILHGLSESSSFVKGALKGEKIGGMNKEQQEFAKKIRPKVKENKEIILDVINKDKKENVPINVTMEKVLDIVGKGRKEPVDVKVEAPRKAEVKPPTIKPEVKAKPVVEKPKPVKEPEPPAPISREELLKGQREAAQSVSKLESDIERLKVTKREMEPKEFELKLKGLESKLKPLRETAEKASKAFIDFIDKQPAGLSIRKVEKGEIKPVIDSPVEKRHEQSDRDLKAAPFSKQELKKIQQKAVTTTVDVSGNIKKRLLKEGGEQGQVAVEQHDLIRGSNSYGNQIYEDAAKGIYKKTNTTQDVYRDRLIQDFRTLAILKYKPDHKRPGNFTSEQIAEYVKDVRKALGDETFKKISTEIKLYFDEYRKQNKVRLDAGLITEKEFKELNNKGDYSPSWYIQHLDPQRSYDFGRGKITVSESGIKKFDEGSLETLEVDSRKMLSQTWNRLQTRVARNRANKALYDLVEAQPDNGIVRILKEKPGKVELKRRIKKHEKALKNPDLTTKQRRLRSQQLQNAQSDLFQKPKSTEEVISVMIDGKRHQMAMSRELAKEWVEIDPAINSQLGNIIGWLTGTKILKAMATGLNPGFAITNFPRDVAHIYLTTQQFSPALPKFLGQISKDLAVTASDAFLRKGAYKDYIKEGGGMEFLTHQGSIANPLKGKWRKIQKVMGYLGETTEVWTRLALRNRSLRNGKTPQSATWQARNYLDFAQGGNWVKAVDMGMPYFNAGIQGTRGVFRSAKTNPKQFIGKVAQIGALSMGLYYANRYVNKDALDQISGHDKTNYFIITSPLKFKDKDGNERHMYFRIAKDQGQQLTSTVFEAIAAKGVGDDFDFGRAAEAAKSLLSIIPTGKMPPVLNAFYGYAANRDWWFDTKIWKGSDISASEEWNRYTNPALVEWGKRTGMSPERTAFAIKQYFTSGNLYTALVGRGLKSIFKELPDADKNKAMEQIISSYPGIKRVMKVTSPQTKKIKELQKSKIDENTRKHIQRRKFDSIVNKFLNNRTPENQKAINKFVSNQPRPDVASLRSRLKFHFQVQNLPNKSWWLTLKSLSPEVRAVHFWTEYQRVDAQGKRDLNKNASRLAGIKSERFLRKLRELNRLKD
jgi:hypothetical protein